MNGIWLCFKKQHRLYEKECSIREEIIIMLFKKGRYDVQ